MIFMINHHHHLGVFDTTKTKNNKPTTSIHMNTTCFPTGAQLCPAACPSEVGADGHPVSLPQQLVASSDQGGALFHGGAKQRSTGGVGGGREGRFALSGERVGVRFG